MKKIIMLFCAGCAAEFNTRDIFYRTKEAIGDEFQLISSVYVRPEEEYDLLITVNGCSKSCIEKENYRGDVLMIDETNYNEAEKLIRERLKI